MKDEDEMLMALADGELDPSTAAALQARIAADPDLRAQYEVFVATAEALRRDPGMGEIPERLIRTIRETPVERPVSAPVVLKRRPLWRPLALAASLAVAFLAGQALAPADKALSPESYAALPAGAGLSLPDGSEIRALASYETAAGLCRHLRRSGPALAEEILLCREGETWKLQLALRSDGAGGSYVPASTMTVELFDQALEAIDAGQPLTPEEELVRLQPAAAERPQR